MDDEAMVRQLLYRYCELQDMGDIDGVSELFRHASYRVEGGGVSRGFDEVRALKASHNKLYDDGTLRTKHVTTNTIVEVDPGGHDARSRSYFTVLQATPTLPLQCVVAGRYHDTFEKVNERWCFTDRLILPDLVGDLSNHLRDNPLTNDNPGRVAGAPQRDH